MVSYRDDVPSILWWGAMLTIMTMAAIPAVAYILAEPVLLDRCRVGVRRRESRCRPQARDGTQTGGASFTDSLRLGELPDWEHQRRRTFRVGYIMLQLLIIIIISTLESVPVAARSKALVCDHSPAEIARFESRRGHGCLSVVSVMCCQVEVSATGWSLVQRSPTYCNASLCVI